MTVRLMIVSSLAAAVWATAASAHVMVQPATTTPGAEETLTFVVGHGCDGQATTALRVELPAGVKLLLPDSKPGWTLDTQRSARGGRTITWKGELSAHQADSFKVRVKLPGAPGPVGFAAIQSCGDTVVRWDEPTPADGAKPKHPIPTVTLTRAGATAAAMAVPGAESLPKGVRRRADGTLADGAGLPLYTFNLDTMVGMSHCEEDCAQMWPPLKAPQDAKPLGDWTLVARMDGSTQWALKDKPLYTYAKDQPSQPPKGLEAPNWKLAR